jgi:hypothetical protein
VRWEKFIYGDRRVGNPAVNLCQVYVGKKETIMASHIDWGAWIVTFAAIASVIVVLVVVLLSVVDRVLPRDHDEAAR